MNPVLVVDDDPITRNLIAAQLVQMQRRVEEAADGVEAWELLRSRAFDLAIVDLGMPHMNGYELIQCIRGHQLTRHLPVVVVTSTRNSQALNGALEAGATAFLTKPLAWSTFRPFIASLLRLTGAASVAAECAAKAVGACERAIRAIDRGETRLARQEISELLARARACTLPATDDVRPRPDLKVRGMDLAPEETDVRHAPMLRAV